MPVNAAQLMVTIGANTSAAESGIMGIGRLLGPGGVLALGAVGAAAAVAGIGIASVKMAGDFQSGMLTIVTGAGESQKNLKLISDGVLQMARDTGTSTKDLTNGLYMIESAGYHGQAALDILKAAAEGAKVGAADLGTVADATTTILKDFGGHGLTASQAVNILIATVANGKTHMEDLAGALSHVLPTASAAGVSLRDVMGAMATMTGEGVPAADAATYLRQTLIALEAPGSQAKKTLESIGLSSDQVANAMHRSLPDALKLIETHLAAKFPVGSAKYVAALKDISGGMRQMQGLLDLTGKHMGDFTTNTQKVGAAASKTGNTITGWDLVQKTFNQRMSVLGETVKTLMIQLGEHLLPIASKLADLFTKSLAPALDLVSGKSKDFSKGLGGELLRAARDAAGFFKSDVQPIMKQLGDLWQHTIVPILHTLADVFVRNILPAVKPVAKEFAEHVMPPLMRIAKDVLPVLNPLLNLFGWIFQHIIGPGLQLVVGQLGQTLSHIADMTDAVSRFMNNPAVKAFGNFLGKGFGQLGQASNKTLASMHLPHFASGGVMGEGGLALVGEAGPEVVALPGGSRVYPNGGYGGGGGGTQTIILQVDGRALARATVRHMPDVIRNATGVRAF